jgi:hypothetical protein
MQITPKNKQRGILYLSVSSIDNARQLWDSGYPDVLVSYFYIRKAKKEYSELIPKINNRGFFMTDSGVFTLLKPYINKKTKKIDFEKYPEISESKFWDKYLKEYTDWLWENIGNVYSCVNLDLDAIVGREIVDVWNDIFFKPLEKYMNVIYIVHKDTTFEYNDLDGFKRYRQYVSEGKKYLGINHDFEHEVQRYYLLARKDGIKLHGFALTSLIDTPTFPFFSHDSSSWLAGVRYGSSYIAKGVRFIMVDSKKKSYRKGLINSTFSKNYSNSATPETVVSSEYLKDEPYAVNVMNAHAWLTFREKYLKNAEIKLAQTNAKAFDYIKKF